MGVELHITRAEHWASNESDFITQEEWMAYVATDPELKPRPENGPYFVQWLGQSKYDEPWLDWFQGNVSSKWPDTALYRKMLQVAQKLHAHVQDDDGTPYRSAEDWSFEPPVQESLVVKPVGNSWLQRLFSRKK